MDVEPEVFWDGASAHALVDEWKGNVGWIVGDENGSHGYAKAAMNGTSGRAIVSDVLKPLHVSVDETWLTDIIPWFFIKTSKSSKSSDQADVLHSVYTPVAAHLGLTEATLPHRPTPKALVEQAVEHQADRLEQELAESNAQTVVTLGEDPRLVFKHLVDQCEGPCTARLTPDANYGKARQSHPERSAFQLVCVDPSRQSIRSLA